MYSVIITWDADLDKIFLRSKRYVIFCLLQSLTSFLGILKSSFKISRMYSSSFPMESLNSTLRNPSSFVGSLVPLVLASSLSSRLDVRLSNVHFKGVVDHEIYQHRSNTSAFLPRSSHRMLPSKTKKVGTLSKTFLCSWSMIFVVFTV